jgi:hypothetical protein
MDLLGPDVLTPPENPKTLNVLTVLSFVLVTLHNFNIRDIAHIHAPRFFPSVGQAY